MLGRDLFPYLKVPLDVRCLGMKLRTVPTIVTAHTFCASRDTRISYQ